MNNKLVLLLLSFCFVSLLAFAINSAKDQFMPTALSSVKAISECEDVSYTENENVLGNCTYETSSMVCSNETAPAEAVPDENQTIILNQIGCVNKTSTSVRECITGTTPVQKTRKDCKGPKAYLINDLVKLNTQDYACSLSEENGQQIVVCDSKYDGNGDGICTSGESCMKFIVNGNKVTQLEKNSKDTFAEKDKSFYLDRASAEVLQ